MKGDYEEFHALRRRKNKANQSQSQNSTHPRGMGRKRVPGEENNRSEYLFINRMMQKFIFFSGISLLLSNLKVLKSRYYLYLALVALTVGVVCEPPVHNYLKGRFRCLGMLSVDFT